MHVTELVSLSGRMCDDVCERCPVMDWCPEPEHVPASRPVFPGFAPHPPRP